MTHRLFDLDVTGKVRRQDNGSQGGWRKKAGYRKAWRTKVKVKALVMVRMHTRDLAPETPKTIRIRARVFNLFDEDGLHAALKPVVDGLRDAGIIHSDQPLAKSGHLILKSQGIDRHDEGVTILVDEGVDL